MATTTPNYGLRKPANADIVNVATDISGNMDLLDAHAHSGTYVALLAASGSDDGPALQALYDAGANAVALKSGSTYIINTPVFLDTNSRTKKFVIHGNGATIRTGSGLPTTPQFTPDTAVKWAFFPNTLRSALSAGVVTCTGNTANGAPAVPLRIEDVVFDGQAGNYGFVFANSCQVEFDACIMTGARVLLSWAGYSDGAQLRNCQNVAPYLSSLSFLIYGVTNGDGIVIDGVRGDSTAGLVKLSNCFGAEISGLVGGVSQFTQCRAIRIGAPHIEADESQPSSTINIDASQVVIDAGWLQSSKTAGKYSIQINDVATGATDLVLRNTTMHTLIRSTETDLAPTAGIYVTAMATSSRIRAEGLSATQYTVGGLFGKGITIDSAVAAIQTALTSTGAVQHLAGGNWELRRRNGAWEIINPLLRGAQVIRPMSTAPTIAQILAGFDSIPGTLTNGTTYEYAVAQRDARGNYSAASAASSVAANAVGSIRLLPSVPGSPCTLVVWRKAGAGVLAGPDVYVAIPWDAYDSRLYDTGVNINGVPWVSSAVPVPNTVAATDRTRSGLVLDAVYLAGGAGSPEGVVIASPGALYQRTDGGASTGTYLKATGTATNTGWVALVPASLLGAASGIATLDGSTTIPDAQIPAAIARDSEVTAAVAAEAALRAAADALLVPNAVGANQTKTRTVGDLTLNSAGFAVLVGGGSLDLTVAAAAGDLLLVGISGVMDSQAVLAYLDVATWVSGAAVNFLGAGSTQGVSAWYKIASVRDGVSGSAPYIVQAGDISGGTVTLVLHGKTASAVNRTLFANGNLPLSFFVANLG